MKMTAIDSLKLADAGEWDAAWELAQQDEGLLSDVTRSRWEKWARRQLAMRRMEKK